ncbi:LysM peptidoglycan-binding domain-containing protein [Streptomyces sp. NPDC058279]|uniref:LysM peptidoglycan-binding domain-containing protein n=1 Tax=Streptomyces sp. NPDC058279 TaxID=3346418 RepID=UPI0036E061FC
MGFGNGPLIAAGLMAGGAALLAGWGLTQLTTSDGGFTQALQGNHAPTEAPGNPYEQNAGGSRAQQPSETGTGKQDESGASPTSKPGRGGENKDEDEDEDKGEPNGSGAPAEPAPKTKPRTIVPGDTLAEISRRTGVPIGILVEANKIQNSDLINQWASRLIPRA